MKLTVHDSSKNNTPILIVDKIGAVGEELARQFSKDFLVVLLSPNPLSEKNEKIIYVPFKKRIPQAPDNRYSKIFIVDDGHSVTRESAFSFIEKAKESSCPLYFIGSLRNVDISHSDQITQSYSNSKVLIFGDLFDKNIFFDQKAQINKFILQARKTGKIEVEENGLSLSFPITFSDTIKLIIKASYLEIPQKIILLFYPHGVTDISLANTFYKINPNIKVDFVKGKKEKEIYIPPNAQHAISKYDLEGKIRDLELESSEDRQLKVIGKDGRRSFIKPLLSLFLFFLFLLLLPLMTTSSYVFLGQKEMAGARKSANLGDFEKSKKQINNSKTFFGIAAKTSQPLILEAKFLGMENDAREIREKIRGGQMVTEAGISLLDGSFLIKDIYSGKSRDPKSDFLKASNLLKNAVSVIQKTKAEGVLPNDISEEYVNLTPFIDLFSNSGDILADILGFEKEKTYLVLLQDETSIRPGGGIIRAFAILRVKNANISDFRTFESSWFNERLETEIESPFVLRRYAKLKNLNFENSNIEAEFVNNAITVSNFYFLASKEKVDGVIALDLSLIQSVLSEIGTVIVSEEKITKDNLIDVNLENSILGKKDFIALVVEAIGKNLENRENIPYFALTKQMGKSIRQKHLLFASPDTSYQNILTANGWSPSLWDNRSKKNDRVNDYVGFSETNLGENNINYFVSRSVSKKVILSDKGTLSSTLTISYKNNSKDKKVSGDYKNYLQIILPEQTKLTSIEIDGEKTEIEKAVTNPALFESSSFRPPQGLEVKERNEMDKSIFGFLLIVPAGDIKTVRLTYNLPYTLSSSQKSFDYSIKVYKQPGLTSYPFDLTFNLPDSFQTIEKDKISSQIKEDQEFQFLISQK
ncbi:MAG: DUF4012 domain-containing protein [Candidatus Levybacteria bacterium]|nr:DUF4012 domain-containing protein [Candidatus Levybacteria bacterium]